MISSETKFQGNEKMTFDIWLLAALHAIGLILLSPLKIKKWHKLVVVER